MTSYVPSIFLLVMYIIGMLVGYVLGYVYGKSKCVKKGEAE